MNLGKTLFAQLMEFVPWTSFARIVARYSGDARVSVLPSTEHFRIMAYAQLTWRESLRDIEVTLGANATKLYAMGLRQAVRCSTLADANERRDWRIWADFAAVLIRRANKLYADEPLGLDVNIAGKVYALDSSTIDLCLSLFDWAPFRSTKAAIKLHTLLDLRGSIPSFIHISDGKMGDVNVLDILPVEAGAFYIMDRGYLDFTRLYTMHQAGPSSSPVPSPISMPGACTPPRWTKPLAWCAIRRWRSMGTKVPATIPSICAGCDSKIH